MSLPTDPIIPVIPASPGQSSAARHWASMATLQPGERLGPLLLAHSPNDDVFLCAVSHEQAEGDAHHLTAFREIGQPT